MSIPSFRYFMIHKPHGMESQFINNFPSPVLGDLTFDFPEGTHAIGRLDKHSEGLLLLTTNKKITRLLFQGPIAHKRTYLVQVKHKVTSEQLLQLQQGVSIRIRGGEQYITPPCDVHLVEVPDDRYPEPFSQIQYFETSWLVISLTEGRYHQVRKMMTAIRHRVLRLIRISIENLELDELSPGEVKEITEEVFFDKLKLGRAIH